MLRLLSTLCHNPTIACVHVPLPLLPAVSTRSLPIDLCTSTCIQYNISSKSLLVFRVVHLASPLRSFLQKLTSLPLYSILVFLAHHEGSFISSESNVCLSFLWSATRVHLGHEPQKHGLKSLMITNPKATSADDSYSRELQLVSSEMGLRMLNLILTTS